MMSEAVAVSIILPSLNVAAYVENCLNSVIGQTLKNIEIICVDAGSTDGTSEILEKYQDTDKRVKLIISEKKSYGYQVNLGIRKASGQYIALVDTDDFVKKDMYEVLYKIGTEKDADFVKADFQEFIEKDGYPAVKKEVRIINDENCYNRLVNMAENQHCFLPQITATWSGIYKKVFLEKNHISHNETPGAAYQDTGFWFLTYAYAKKGYFVNKPFYQYRVDNPDASVKSRGKINCICDEFDFVMRKLEEGRSFDTFQDTFCYIFYRKYKRNLERIKKEYQLEFLQHFSQDFSKLLSRGALHTEAWNTDSRLEIKEIMKDARGYHADTLKNRKAFIEGLQKYSKIIIYGFGKVGKILFDNMIEPERIISFAVTEAKAAEEDADAEYKGIPVKGLESLREYCDMACVVIAVKIPEFQREMKKFALQCGFKNVITIPYGSFDFE